VHTVYLSLGSNLGNKLDYIFQAKIFVKSDIGIISQESHLYLSEPWVMLHIMIYKSMHRGKNFFKTYRIT